MTQQTAAVLLEEDLRKSGLKVQDLSAYIVQEAELSAVGVRSGLYLSGPESQSPGYVIPYFDAQGNRIPFYRVRLFAPVPKGPKYLQPRSTGSWMYFPPQFAGLVKQAIARGYKAPIIITEGEKKAAKAAMCGFIACAVGGVFSWRSKTLVVPEGTSLAKNKDGNIVLKVDDSVDAIPTTDRRAFLAGGLGSVIELVRQHQLRVVIVFDSDSTPNPDVQRAAAELAFELRANGVPTKHIRQLTLPAPQGSKVGLDDYLMEAGPGELDKRIQECLNAKSAYPTHPNLASIIGRQLSGRAERNECKELSLMILADMDRTGQRMIDKNTGSPFFFDEISKTLMPVNLLHHHEEPLHETKFGEYLYRRYDISQMDSKLIGWLASGFTGEDPITTVEPRSVYALTPSGIAYQVGDGHFVHVTDDPQNPIQIRSNGNDGLLFRADQVEPVDPYELVKEFQKQLKWLQTAQFEDLYWTDATKQFKFIHSDDALVMTILSYISPWLQRWNGAQLPVELMIGEPGSGKSSMYALRLEILTGRPALRNLPTDIRDWYASITAQNGMHVIDNVAFATKEMKQRISDEMCRLVTEPSPTVEMRRLFTTSENIRIPVRTVFGMTAIQQPFVNADIMQRSVIMELSAIGDQHSSDWNGNQLRMRGGRIGWLAHQLAVLHVFLAKAKHQAGFWSPGYRSKHRLAHFEQLFQCMGEVLKVPDLSNVTRKLTESSQNQVSEYDWTMEGLKAFHAEHISVGGAYSCLNIATWALERSEFEENQVLTNARRLSRYIKSHAYMVQSLAGFEEADKRNNSQYYTLRPVK
jgi:hypothetical protein